MNLQLTARRAAIIFKYGVSRLSKHCLSYSKAAYYPKEEHYAMKDPPPEI